MTDQETQVAETLLESSAEPLGKPFAELLGWYVTVGHAFESPHVDIYEPRKSTIDFCKRIGELLQLLGSNYEITTRSRAWGDAEGQRAVISIGGPVAAKLKLFAPGKERMVSWRILQRPDGELRAFLRGFFCGDESFLGRDEYTEAVTTSNFALLAKTVTDTGGWENQTTSWRYKHIEGDPNSPFIIPSKRVGC